MKSLHQVSLLVLLNTTIGFGQMLSVDAHPYQDKSAESYQQEQANWRALINREPKNPDAYLQLAASLSSEASEGYWCNTRAIEVYRQAIAVVAPHPEIHAQLGKALITDPDTACDSTENQAQIQARKKEGLFHLQKAIDLNPTREDYYITLGNGLKEQGQSDAAIAAYKQAVNLPVKPNQASIPYLESLEYLIIGDYFQEKADLEAAAAAYRKALAIAPNDPKAQNSLKRVELLLKLKC